MFQEVLKSARVESGEKRVEKREWREKKKEQQSASGVS